MEVLNKQALYALTQEVSALLYEHWDPLGLAGEIPKDEYDRYAEVVVIMLIKGCTEDEIKIYLVEVEQQSFEIDSSYVESSEITTKVICWFHNLYTKEERKLMQDKSNTLN